ncbi:acyl carrier protein [Cytobacillus oceanisediminis]|uniref:acyl carrier protein n=1 Tax=Cytobacillus oceanisediminis TaxID=665099 RepID=UPI001C22F126|nr:acyl carrier protein [Cytobacillus oceanisediminis]MBU8772046.1 acyl carrier protein [Cytobacillus oceanisediminis]
MQNLDIEMTVIECLQNLIGNKELSHDSELLGLGIDSITFIRLVIDLEERFEFEVDDEDIILENFSTLEKVLELVNKYI